MAEFNGKKGKWVTIEGRHIFIADGQSIDEAVKKAFGMKKEDAEDRKEKQIANNKKVADELNAEKKEREDGTKTGSNKPIKPNTSDISKYEKPNKTPKVKLSKEDLQRLVEKHKKQEEGETQKVRDRFEVQTKPNASTKDFLKKHPDGIIHGKPHFPAPKDKVFNKGALENGYYSIPNGYHIERVTEEQAYEDSIREYNEAIKRLKAKGMDDIVPPKPKRGLFNGGGWVRLVPNKK